MSGDRPQPERSKTDTSLAGERAKTDAAFAEKTALEQKADAVVDRARNEADEILSAARAEADDKLQRPAESDPSVLAGERVLEDAALDALRAGADEAVRRERAISWRLLARLLPLERDQTDRHLQVERARSDAALASRDDFLGMVSHDLRDLLAGIVMSSACIGEQIGDQDGSRDTRIAVERIQRSAGRMTRLIGDLVDIAGIDAGKLDVKPTQGDAGDVVSEAVELWQPQAIAKGLALCPVVTGKVVAAFDYERILQVLGNLITNAIKFSRPGGRVLVGVETIGENARFSVTDTGEGIPSDKLEAIFERFSQVGKNDRRGLGLGLYISRCLVQAHGGQIWVESEPGAGSAFFFTVPSEAAARPAAHP